LFDNHNFSAEFGTLQASGYHIPWHLYSEGDGQKWPTFTPSQLSQHGMY